MRFQNSPMRPPSSLAQPVSEDRSFPWQVVAFPLPANIQRGCKGLTTQLQHHLLTTGATLKQSPVARLDLNDLWRSNIWQGHFCPALKALKIPLIAGPQTRDSCLISQTGEQLKVVLAQLLHRRRRRINMTLSSWRPCQGDTIAILVSVPPPRGLIDWATSTLRRQLSKQPLVQVMLGGSEICAFPMSVDSGIWRALAPTTPLTEPGPRSLTVDVKDGRHEMYNGFVEICPKVYPVESIWLSEAKSGILGTVAEKEAVNAFVSSKSLEQNWCGPFKLPADGDVTTGFGLQRYYNGVFADSYYHRGVDYGADEGTPVTAPASGVVALVGRESDGFELHGNCVGLDHGQGVTSMLMHLSSVTVEKGVMVQAGQSIGTVGQTGLATGPHLHWGLFVNGEAVDPQPWMVEQPWL